MPLYGLFGTKPGGTLEFGRVFARFEGDDPVDALQKFLKSREDLDVAAMLEENFETYGHSWHYSALFCLDMPQITILKVAPDPGTDEVEVTVATDPDADGQFVA